MSLVLDLFVSVLDVRLSLVLDSFVLSWSCCLGAVLPSAAVVRGAAFYGGGEYGGFNEKLVHPKS
jgi:hypothetical protein